MDVLILAAGQGTRLFPLTKDLPKALLKISDSDTILSHQLKNVMNFGVKDVKIVTGFKHELIEEEVKKFDGQLNISLIYNDQALEKNNLYSLWLAKRHIQEDVIIINGDDVFDWKILNSLDLNPNYDGCLLVNKKESFDDDDMRIIDNDGILEQVSKSIPPSTATGESIGIMHFSKQGFDRLGEILDDITENDPDAGKLWYLHAVEKLAQTYNKVKVSFIGDNFWGEIDFIEDLERIQKYFKSNNS